VTEEGWRLALDPAVCDGHGICALRCPDRISLDEWGYALVDGTVIDDHRVLRRAHRAAAACPAGALTVVPKGGRDERKSPAVLAT
jgi:ferredoxin